MNTKKKIMMTFLMVFVQAFVKCFRCLQMSFRRKKLLPSLLRIYSYFNINALFFKKILSFHQIGFI